MDTWQARLASNHYNGGRPTSVVEITQASVQDSFFPEPQVDPDYLSKSHEDYSPKLAAAIQAWKVVSAEPARRRGKTVKQALIIWLRQHGNEYGLTKEDGNPNEKGIEEVAKVANWETTGGVPKTPTNE